MGVDKVLRSIHVNHSRARLIRVERTSITKGAVVADLGFDRVVSEKRLLPAVRFTQFTPARCQFFFSLRSSVRRRRRRQVSNKMESGEWVYLCVQDLQTGHVITLHDNRALLMAQAQAGSDEEKNAFRKMLGQ